MSPPITYEEATASDFERLVGLRIAAMRESLERLGRFDEARSRARFGESFEPTRTRHIVVEGKRVGFVALKPEGDGLRVDHLYVHPSAQKCGVGGAVLAAVVADADARGVPLFVTALRGSDSKRFYLRYGFVLTGETEWDVHYRRDARGHQPGTV